jgi:hypothetical protein
MLQRRRRDQKLAHGEGDAGTVGRREETIRAP